MKLLTLSFFAMLALTISSCADQSTNPEQGPVSPMSTGSPAHPALAYIGSKTVGNAIHQTVAVMDTDYTHQTNIYTAGLPQPLSAGSAHPTWSYDGSKISFLEQTSTSFVCNLRTISVAVINGVPTGSNVTTVYSTPASDSALFFAQAYSSTSANKIAFATVQNYSAQAVKLYTIPAAGGSPTLLATKATGGVPCEVRGLTWSPDDTKIAYTVVTMTDRRYISTWSVTIHIVNASTGAEVDSIVLPKSYRAIGLEWSRSGQNVIAFAKTDSLNNRTLNYYDATAKTTSTGVTGISMDSWSPNNSSVLVQDRYHLLKSKEYSITDSTLGNAVAGFLNWKR